MGPDNGRSPEPKFVRNPRVEIVAGLELLESCYVAFFQRKNVKNHRFNTVVNKKKCTFLVQFDNLNILGLEIYIVYFFFTINSESDLYIQRCIHT